MCDVPSVAVFCSESTECFPGIIIIIIIIIIIYVVCSVYKTSLSYRSSVCCCGFLVFLQISLFA